ncbi:hypothetical protein [Paenibacillus sp. S02]|uniref:hypothetical protein n=1 Tax=Paenibacillus sp. S02 TaxID=2823904 RepID=UPI001C64A82C|nr:hypothetical protein [Paenibacillus sp. S02]QYK66997.1 hypothetical protein KAI36_02144 [Paenibacillus sp. S02]
MRKVKWKKKLMITSMTFVLSLMAATVSADTGTAHIKIGSISGGASNISYWYDSSLSTYGQTGAVDNARSKWDAASSRIGWSSGSSSSAKLKVYAGNYSLPGGTYGSTSYFLSNGQQVDAGAITNGSNYDVARVVLDAGWTSGWSQSERFMNAGHELGHVLGLNHFQNAPAHAGEHWMKSGRYALSSPTSTDTSHVVKKWGD